MKTDEGVKIYRHVVSGPIKISVGGNVMAATFKHFCVLVMAISIGILSSNETLAQQLPPSNGGGAPDTIIAQGHSNVLTLSAAEAYVRERLNKVFGFADVAA